MLENTAVANLQPAPYADTPIELSMLSTSSSRYKTYFCIECRHPFLQRDGDTIYRINNNNEPSTARFSEGYILTRCDNCKQKYAGTISVSLTSLARTNVMRSLQTIYIVPAAIKVARYIRCLDCGGSFLSLTDRVIKIVDNSVPVEYVAANQIGVLETRCKINHCRQRWALHV